MAVPSSVSAPVGCTMAFHNWVFVGTTEMGAAKYTAENIAANYCPLQLSSAHASQPHRMVARYDRTRITVLLVGNTTGGVFIGRVLDPSRKIFLPKYRGTLLT